MIKPCDFFFSTSNRGSYGKIAPGSCGGAAAAWLNTWQTAETCGKIWKTWWKHGGKKHLEDICEHIVGEHAENMRNIWNTYAKFQSKHMWKDTDWKKP